MKKKKLSRNILKRIGVLIIAIVMILSSVMMVGGTMIITGENIEILDSRGDIEVESLSHFPDDELDQTNPSTFNDWFQSVYGKWQKAQEIRPTKEILTRVFLYLHIYASRGYDPQDLDTQVHVYIRENLTGENLATCYVNTKDFDFRFNFYPIEFDFQDILITPNEPLYIICKSDYGEPLLHVGWYLKGGNPYDFGSAWFSNNYGDSWKIFTNNDYCFQTYGRNNTPPDTPLCSYDISNDCLLISATDPDGDQVRYGVDWDNDGTVDKWTSFVASGIRQSINCEHRKNTAGVVAEDVYGAQSDWVSQKSKNKAINTPFLQNHPHMFPLLRQLLRLEA